MCARPHQGKFNKHTAPGDTLTDFFSDTGSTPVSSTILCKSEVNLLREALFRVCFCFRGCGSVRILFFLCIRYSLARRGCPSLMFAFYQAVLTFAVQMVIIRTVLFEPCKGVMQLLPILSYVQHYKKYHAARFEAASVQYGKMGSGSRSNCWISPLVILSSGTWMVTGEKIWRSSKASKVTT